MKQNMTHLQYIDIHGVHIEQVDNAHHACVHLSNDSLRYIFFERCENNILVPLHMRPL